MAYKERSLNTVLLLIIATILMGVILHYTASVFVPFAIAIVCLYIFSPALQFFKKRLHLPRILAVMAVFVLFFAFGSLVGYVLYSSLRSLVGQYPLYEQRFSTMLANIAQRYDLNEFNVGQVFNSLQLQEAIGRVLVALSGGSFSFISGLVLVSLFLLFLLLEEGNLIRNALANLSRDQGASVRKIIKDVNDKVRRYLLAKVFISFCTAVCVYLGFLFIGVDFPFVWGVLAFLFNFIPSIGSIVITLLASLFVIIQFAPNWLPVILAISFISLVEITFGNVIEPRVVGRNLNINAVVILLALLIWAIIWGVAGMFLSVPMTVLIISILEAIPLTRPISHMAVARDTQAKKE